MRGLLYKERMQKNNFAMGISTLVFLEEKIWEGVLAFRKEKVQEIQGVSAHGHEGVGIYVLTLYFYAKFTVSGA